MHQFDEGHKEFKGFSAKYAEDILPILEFMEAERVAAMGQFKGDCIFIILGAIAGLFMLITSGHNQFIFIVFVIAAILFLWRYSSHIKPVKTQTKTLLLQQITEFIGLSYSEHVGKPVFFAPMISHHLLPHHYDRVRFEDQLSGHAHGANFTVIECKMEKKRKNKNGHTSWEAVFHGALFEVGFHRKFEGKILVLRDKGWFNAKSKKTGGFSKLKRVGLASPKFEKLFEAYGTDQVEARYILTPTFMEALMALEESVEGRNIRFGFFNQKLYVAIETPNRFEVGSMRKSLTDTVRTQKIIDEFGALFDVIDGVLNRSA